MGLKALLQNACGCLRVWGRILRLLLVFDWWCSLGSRSETLDVMGADGRRVILFKASFTFMLDGVANVGLKLFERH